MADQICNPNFDKALPLIGRDENLKYLFDRIMQGGLTQDADERRDARRRASNDAAFDHLTNMMTVAVGFGGLLAAAQEGEGEVETAGGTEEEAEAGTALAGQAVATSLGNLASALVPIVAGTAGVVTVQTLSAVLAAVVTAAGTAAKSAQPAPAA